jgi:serine/threonine-protein kinase RsbW
MGEPGQAPRAMPLVAPSPLLTEAIDRDRVTDLRHLLAERLRAAGLAGQPLDDFVLAVNELLTNVVRHGGGNGRLQLWRDGQALVCEVSDRGPGLGVEHLGQHNRPAPGTVGGWGLWLADRLSDSMAVWTGPAGTTVRLTAALPQQAKAATDPIE